MGSVFIFTVHELLGYLFENNVYLDASIVEQLFHILCSVNLTYTRGPLISFKLKSHIICSNCSV